mgnify:FL=1
MVRVKEVIILKDLSLLDEKIGMFKIRKLLFIGFGVMLGYSMINSGNIAGFLIIVAFVILAFMPDRSISAEHRLMSMLYFYTLKSKPQDVQKKQGKKLTKNKKMARNSNVKLGSLLGFLKGRTKGEKQ